MRAASSDYLGLVNAAKGSAVAEKKSAEDAAAAG